MNLRHAAAGASLVLLATLSACGGGDDDGGSAAPDNASKDEFCTSYNSLYESLMTAAPEDGDTEEAEKAAIGALKDWADSMAETGTPEEMPDDVRNGFELILGTAQDIDDDAKLSDIEDLGSDYSKSEEEDAEAFTTWAQEECPMDVPELEEPEESATSVPSESQAPDEVESEPALP